MWVGGGRSVEGGVGDDGEERKSVDLEGGYESKPCAVDKSAVWSAANPQRSRAAVSIIHHPAAPAMTAPPPPLTHAPACSTEPPRSAPAWLDHPQGGRGLRWKRHGLAGSGGLVFVGLVAAAQ